MWQNTKFDFTWVIKPAVPALSWAYFSFGYHYENEKENLFCSWKWKDFPSCVQSSLFNQGRKTWKGLHVKFTVSNRALWIGVGWDRDKHFPPVPEQGEWMPSGRLLHFLSQLSLFWRCPGELLFSESLTAQHWHSSFSLPPPSTAQLLLWVAKGSWHLPYRWEQTMGLTVYSEIMGVHPPGWRSLGSCSTWCKLWLHS